MGRSIVEGLRRLVAAAVVAATATTGLATPQPADATTPADVALDVAALGRSAALRHCATRSFAADPDSVRVLYGHRQRSSPTATSRTFVLRNRTGQVLLCDLTGRDRPSVLPLPRTSPSRPAVLVAAGQRRWSCDGTRLASFRMTSWLMVQDPVRSARVRYSVDGEPGPWFTAARHGRFLHLQSWTADVAATSVLRVETQLLGRDGHRVTVAGLPSGAHRLDGCGTDTLIG